MFFSEEELRQIERKIGVTRCRDQKLLARAFVDECAPGDVLSAVGGNNRTLATHGDAVIKNQFIRHLLVHYPCHAHALPKMIERLLMNERFADTTVKIGLIEHWRHGYHQTVHGAGTLFEAVVGVLDLDQPNGAIPFIYRHILKPLEEHLAEVEAGVIYDPIFILNHVCRETYGLEPVYHRHEFHGNGNGHDDRPYSLIVELPHRLRIIGRGTTKSAARFNGAERMLQAIAQGVLGCIKHPLLAAIAVNGHP